MSNDKKTVLVVGAGFVGNAVIEGFKDKSIVLVADPRLGTSIGDYKTLDIDFVFICLPTPMDEKMRVDVTGVFAVCKEVNVLWPQAVIVLKSTIVPEYAAALAQILPEDKFVYNPEFLTEANAVQDFKSPKLHVYGSLTHEPAQQLNELYINGSTVEILSMSKPPVYVSPAEASYIKYTINSFLSLKVAFFNQLADHMKSWRSEFGIFADFSTVTEAVTGDPRIGSTHMQVPGPDGRRGFGSACFSKDVPALLLTGGGESLSILQEAWDYNCDVRNSYAENLPREIAQKVQFNKICRPLLGNNYDV